ncbi:MAG: type II toxin-antitoxin system VapC family toxin [Nanoarchaeota archaeon]
MKYLDSNIFLFAFSQNSPQCKFCRDLLESIMSGKDKACTSYLTWDEVVYHLKKIFGRETAILKSKKLLRFPNIKFVDVDMIIIDKAHQLLEKYNLEPRDSIHAATAILLGAKEFVSDDADFDQINELKRVKIVK